MQQILIIASYNSCGTNPQPPTERPTAIYAVHVGSISLVRFHFTEYTEHERRGKKHATSIDTTPC